MNTTEMITAIKHALETSRFPFAVSGAVLFGSHANNSFTPDSDIDLLVVAENINPKLHRRKKEMLALNFLPVPFFPFPQRKRSHNQKRLVKSYDGKRRK